MPKDLTVARTGFGLYEEFRSRSVLRAVAKYLYLMDGNMVVFTQATDTIFPKFKK